MYINIVYECWWQLQRVENQAQPWDINEDHFTYKKILKTIKDPMLSPVGLHTTRTFRKHLFSVERNERDVLGSLEYPIPA